MSTLPIISAGFELNVHYYSGKYIVKLSLQQNRKGIIYKVTAVLFAHGYDILEANIETVEGQVRDIFAIRNIYGKTLTSTEFDQIKKEIYELVFGDMLVIDYLNQFELPQAKPSSHVPSIYIYNPEGGDSTVLDIHTKDRPGLLFEISQLLYLMDIDILSVTATTERNGMARDTFLIRIHETERLDNETQEKLKEGLLSFL